MAGSGAPAVLAAILAPALLVSKDNGQAELALNLDNLLLIAALPAFLVAWFTRSFFGTVLAGMGAVALLRLLA